MVEKEIFRGENLLFEEIQYLRKPYDGMCYDASFFSFTNRIAQQAALGGEMMQKRVDEWTGESSLTQ